METVTKLILDSGHSLPVAQSGTDFILFSRPVKIEAGGKGMLVTELGGEITRSRVFMPDGFTGTMARKPVVVIRKKHENQPGKRTGRRKAGPRKRMNFLFDPQTADRLREMAGVKPSQFLCRLINSTYERGN